MISKDEILKRGAVEVHAKVGGIRQRHTLKVHMEKTAWGMVPFCVSSFQLPVSELVRIAKEIGLPVKCKGMSVFPPGKAAQDFAVKKEEDAGKENEREMKKKDEDKKNHNDDKKKTEKKKRLAHDSVLNSDSEDSENDDVPEEKEEEEEEIENTSESAEESETAQEEPEETEEADQEDEKEKKEDLEETNAENSSESTAIPEPILKTAEELVGPIIEDESPTQQIQIENIGNGQNIETGQKQKTNSEQKEKDDKDNLKDKKKFASDVLSEGILR